MTMLMNSIAKAARSVQQQQHQQHAGVVEPVPDDSQQQQPRPRAACSSRGGLSRSQSAALMNMDMAPNKRRFPSVYAGTTAALKKTLDHHHSVAVENFQKEDCEKKEELAYYTKTASILFDYFCMTDDLSHGDDSPEDQDADSSSAEASASTSGGGNKGIVISKSLMLQDNRNSIIKYFMGPATAPQEPDDGRPSSPSSCDGDAPPDLREVLKESVAPPSNPIHFVKDDRAALLEKYMCVTTPSYVKNASILQSTATSKLDDATLNACGHCGSTDRTLLSHDGMMICNACATVEYVMVDHERPSYKEPPKEISYFAYKRINHLNEWLNQVQGKETTDIPEDLYDKILIEINKRKIKNMADLTQAQLKSIIRKLGQNKYFEHSSHIMYRLNGVSVPQLSPELEEKLRSMFKQIQVPFLKYSPPDRKNFLSYSYCINRMLQLLEKDDYLVHFPLLKSREKLQAQDRIWKKICADVGWQFIKSI